MSDIKPVIPVEKKASKQAVESSEVVEKQETPAVDAMKTPGVFEVSFDEKSGRYEARDADEAWAMFNTAHKTSYGPRVARKITKVG